MPLARCARHAPPQPVNLAGSPGTAAETLFHAPFAVLAPHLTGGNPVLLKIQRKRAITGSE